MEINFNKRYRLDYRPWTGGQWYTEQSFRFKINGTRCARRMVRIAGDILEYRLVDTQNE